MKQQLAALALVTLGLALGAAWRAPVAQAQSQRGWDYLVFQLDPEDYSDKQDYRALLEREGPRRVEAAFFEHVLDHLGKEGWELVTHERRGANLVYLYLRRPA
jgi:hypothetical protein